MKKQKRVGFWKYFLWMVVIMAIFTAVDAFIHANFEILEIYYYPIPQFLLGISSLPLFWYAIGKFFSTIIFGALLFYFVKRGKNNFTRALILSLPIVLLLEGRYYLSGAYGDIWHLYNITMHFIVLLATSYLVFTFSKIFK